MQEVTNEAYPDPTQFDPKSKYFDPKSRKDDPRWKMVDIQLEKKFSRIFTLQQIKKCATDPNNPLHGIELLRQSRLSISPLTDSQFDFILAQENQPNSEPNTDPLPNNSTQETSLGKRSTDMHRISSVNALQSCKRNKRNA